MYLQGRFIVTMLMQQEGAGKARKPSRHRISPQAS